VIGEQTGPSRQFVAVTAIGIAVALLVGGVGLVVGILANRNSTSEPSSSSLVPYTYPVPTTYETGSSITTRQPQPSPTTRAVPQDPVQQLRQIAGGDRSFVYAQLADRWVPQLSSKRPGVVDNGVVWDDSMTLQEHMQLRQRYPSARLLWSGDWSTFSGPDFWVTVVGITFSDSAGALQWCRNQGFDRDHCVAKIISTTHIVEGSTAYN
jgi:hypothetical protein